MCLHFDSPSPELELNKSNLSLSLVQAKDDMKRCNFSVGEVGIYSTKLHFQLEQKQTLTLPCQHGDVLDVLNILTI